MPHTVDKAGASSSELRSELPETLFAVSSIWGSAGTNTQKHRLSMLTAIGMEEALGSHVIGVRAELGDSWHLQSWLTVYWADGASTRQDGPEKPSREAK